MASIAAHTIRISLILVTSVIFNATYLLSFISFWTETLDFPSALKHEGFSNSPRMKNLYEVFPKYLCIYLFFFFLITFLCVWNPYTISHTVFGLFWYAVTHLMDRKQKDGIRFQASMDEMSWYELTVCYIALSFSLNSFQHLKDFCVLAKCPANQDVLHSKFRTWYTKKNPRRSSAR